MTTPARSSAANRPSAAPRLGRRGFHKSVAAAASSVFAFHFIPSHAWGALERPALAAIGASGKGASDISGAKGAGFSIAALVDVVDGRKLGSNRLPRNQGKTQAEYSTVPFFTDYREMFERMGDKIDAVTVSTPDHHHFHASLQAMQLGKHVYCQKPLTHCLWEARKLADVAQATGVKTQMGNQAHAKDHMRRVVELIRGGLIGQVREVHGWTNRPIWPQGMSEPPPAEPVPAWINWEQWIGPAPFVDYSPKIAPFNWRGIWDYGIGALGDMACHILDIGWWAVNPGAPQSVSAEQQGGTKWSPPISSKITWQFAPSQYTAAEGCRFYWYDGYVNARFDPTTWSLVKDGDDFNHPAADVMRAEDYKAFDNVIIGDKGRLFFTRDRNNWRLDANYEIDGFAWPEQTLPRATNQDSYREWLDAIEGKIPRSESDFAAAGPFTEMIQLGTLAQRLPGETLEWDAQTLTVKGRPETRAWIQREYRPGWEVRT